MKGRIDETAPVRNTSSIEIDAPAAEVWALLFDLRGWERWWPEHQVLELGEIAPGERFRWRLGGVKISSRFAVVTEGRELTWSGVVLGVYRAVDRNLVEAAARRAHPRDHLRIAGRTAGRAALPGRETARRP